MDHIFCKTISKAYLDSKRLSLDEWLRCVQEGRRGDILCIYLLSLATGVHTFVHLKNNKIWCTLKNVPTSHHELQNQCEQHLVYLGFGIFLRMQRRPTTPVILGTVSGADPATQQLLLASVGKSIKSDIGLTGTTNGKMQSTKASAAAGSKSQLPHLEAEMKPKPDPDVYTRPTKQSMVQVTPFQVVLTRLTKQQIERYTKQPRIQSVRTPVNTDTCVQTVRSSPVRTHSMMTKARKSAHKKWLISGQPSKLCASNYMFQVHRHILWKHHHRIYIKCRVKGCNLAYISFNSVKDLNAHHWLYHPNSHYKCHQRKKTVHIPSTWRYHQYCQYPKLHKCGDCNKFFLFKSTMKQHHRRHISQRLFKYFHGGCYMSYKHPQDLSRHTAMHQQITFECDLCDKTFKQK